MSNDDSITLVGTLTADPAVKYLNNGDAVCNFSIARNTQKKEGNEWVDGPTHFYDCVAWRSLAENLGSLSKGTRVIVFGKLDQETWKADDGSNRSKHKVVAEAVGPDLRWATASVTKNDKGSGNSSGASQSRPVPAEDPFA